MNAVIKLAKKTHYRKKLEENKDNPKRLWSTLFEIIHRKKGEDFLPKHFNHEGKDISDPDEIAQKFNKFFSSVGVCLDQQLPLSNMDPLMYIPDVQDNTDEEFELQAVSALDIQIIISQMNMTGAGVDGINSKLLKKLSPYIITEITHLMNLCLTKKVFPKCLKIAQIKPIFKAGSKFMFTNYRPISILPTFSKILERIMYNQLSQYLNDNNILYDNQFGFRKNHSTYMPVSMLYDHATLGMSKGQTPVAIFLDLRKAFDTVHHAILLRKMQKYGVGGDTLNIFKSYLEERTQILKLGSLGVTSSPEPVTIGVPQGSIIGPLLFSVYINDMHRISDKFKLYNFADDSVLTFVEDDLENTKQTIATVTPLIFKWLCANRLSLNTSKTFYQIYSHLDNKPNINIEFNGQQINRSKLVRYLGITIEEPLTWKAHIKRTYNTVSRNIGLITRARSYLDKKTMLTLYHAIVLPYLSYGAFIWGSTYPSNLTCLIMIQKRIIRRIDNAYHRAPSSPIFKKLNLLKITDIITQQQLLILHKILTGNMPLSYASFFNLWVPNRETRQVIHFAQPFAELNYRKFSFTVACPRAWNNIIASKIPDLADVPISKYLFKKITKEMFVEDY